MEYSLLPYMVLSYSIPVPPPPHDRENFLTLSLPLEVLRNLALSHKTLFLVNLLITITIVFNKSYFVNKYIL